MGIRYAEYSKRLSRLINAMTYMPLVGRLILGFSFLPPSTALIYSVPPLFHISIMYSIPSILPLDF